MRGREADTSRDAAVAAAAAAFDDGRFVRDLATLVAFPTESQNPARAEVLTAYLTEAMVPRLGAAGYTCGIFPNADPRGGPFLVAERHEGCGLPTVLTYGHGDVIHGQEGQWRTGLEPFVLSVDGEEIYGRGTADNKGQHLINIMALEQVIAVRGHLGFNSRIIIEMSEETGSAGLAEFFGAMKDQLSADVLIASDGPRLQPDIPTVFTGSRGAVSFDLVADLREGAHHSGNWGGLLADPAMLIAQALALITDARGDLRIPEWRPDSLTTDVRAALRDLPVTGDEGPGPDEDWGAPDLSLAERAYGWNSFAVLAMTSGRPDAPVNAIAGTARATCQLRFVTGTDTAALLPALRAVLDAHGLGRVEIRPHDEGYFPATRLVPGHPWTEFVCASLQNTTGKRPHLLPNLAGSLPNHVFTEVLGMPTVWIPHSWRGCSQHAPDEHMRTGVCREGLEIMTGLFWDIGAADAGVPRTGAFGTAG
ncbi:M20 family metallopeptidase [Roseobacter ponti]|uniref:M20 family metallopeptidase n=1 Tax=Roseobacter ponti TaxID=1891787 RepID=A0A858SR52_9RHOB|nr:M20 family metallopeptidase [Roseobacter ponti]QJF51145.1 M20 family metallopeptidase [Roseobacter ponti]